MPNSFMHFLPVFSSESCVFLVLWLVPLVSFSPCSLRVVVKIATLCIPRIPCCPSAYIPSCQLWQCSQQYPALLAQHFSCLQKHLTAAVFIMLSCSSFLKHYLVNEKTPPATTISYWLILAEFQDAFDFLV